MRSLVTSISIAAVVAFAAGCSGAADEGDEASSGQDAVTRALATSDVMANLGTPVSTIPSTLETDKASKWVVFESAKSTNALHFSSEGAVDAYVSASKTSILKKVKVDAVGVVVATDGSKPVYADKAITESLARDIATAKTTIAANTTKLGKTPAATGANPCEADALNVLGAGTQKANVDKATRIELPKGKVGNVSKAASIAASTVKLHSEPPPALQHPFHIAPKMLAKISITSLLNQDAKGSVFVSDKQGIHTGLDAPSAPVDCKNVPVSERKKTDVDE